MTTNHNKRLIEVAFPLKQVSLDSVHEKNVRHGHISTLHIWPARRPLAASRAALIATLLPDPGDADKRKALLERMAGRVVEKIESKRLNGRVVEKVKEVTEGGILHWGRENGPDLDWFRDEIRKAYGGRAPKVLDPFAGGGAIPLEAMRLGCEVTAMDINPVAWFILKCTLEYPQRLAGQTRPLPAFALEDRDFMEAFLKKAKGFKGARLRTQLERLGHGNGEVQLEALAQAGSSGSHDPTTDADLAWHVRAWGRWVLARARRELASVLSHLRRLPAADAGRRLRAAADAPLGHGRGRPSAARPAQRGVRRRLPPGPAQSPLGRQADGRLPLGADRAVQAVPGGAAPAQDALAVQEGQQARAADDGAGRRRAGVVFGVQADVSRNGGNPAQRREHDRRIGAGTMSRTGATCPRCETIMTMDDIRYEGRAGRLGAVMTAVVVDGPKGKEYRLPTDHERAATEVTEEQLQALYADIPFGLPEEQTPKAGSGASRAFSVDGYGLRHLAQAVHEPAAIGALGSSYGASSEMRRNPPAMRDYPGAGRSQAHRLMCLRLSDRLGNQRQH